MYGKAFASMYEGSMYGAGAVVFAVWGYVIARQRPSKVYGSIVTLHPGAIGAAIGEKSEDVEGAIEFLCRPDAKSHNKECGGARLVKLDHYEFRVVSGKYYRAIRNEEERREYQRMKQAEYREKKKGRKGKPLPGEAAFEKAVERGAGEAELSRLSDNSFMQIQPVFAETLGPVFDAQNTGV
jgi:hypothetical protein